MLSTSSASQTTLDLDPTAPSCTWMRPRYDVRPPPRATDLLTMLLVVRGAACTILAPASWCWPSPAKAIDRVSPEAPSPSRKQAGYFIVTLEPMLPSIHSMRPPSCTAVRLVTRL